MTTLTTASLAELASVQEPPCLSLYQPTHRRPPEKQQDPIRFRNLLDKDTERFFRAEQMPTLTGLAAIYRY